MVESLGTCPTRAESDALVARFAAEMETEGWGLWAVEVAGGPRFVGMGACTGSTRLLPCAPAVEIGWRLSPDHWGHGYATEAAAAALHVGFTEGALTEIVAFTTTLNLRSQQVMGRIGMVRDPQGDFDHPSVPARQPAPAPRAVPGQTVLRLTRGEMRVENQPEDVPHRRRDGGRHDSIADLGGRRVHRGTERAGRGNGGRYVVDAPIGERAVGWLAVGRRPSS